MVAKAQLKIGCMIIYYTILGVMGLVIFTINEASSSNIDGLRDYILCESGGQSDCVLDLGISADANSAISIIIYIMLSLLPVLAILLSFSRKKQQRRERTSSNLPSRGSRKTS